MWWTLRLLWPQRVQETTWIAFLFAIYPGFQQQYISVTYSHGWITLGGFLLSLGLMLEALRRRRWFWPLMLASWLLDTLIIFTDEYFFGLELLRPLFLWFVLSEQPAAVWRKIRQIALQFAPYAASMAGFLVWRLFLQKTPRGDIQIFDRLKQEPLAAAIELIRTILQDVFETGVLAWGQVFKYASSLSSNWLSLAIYLLILLLTGVGTFLFFKQLAAASPASACDPGADDAVPWAFQTLLTGLYALLLGGWPFWATYLPLKLKFPWDRFTTPMMFGACLVLVGILVLLIRDRTFQFFCLSLAIGLSAGFHYQLANQYQQDWETQKNLFWQLTWRAPGIQPGTTLLTANIPLKYFTDNSLTAPLNWVYAPDNSSRQMPYLFYDIKVRTEAGTLKLEPGYTIDQPYRATYFKGSTSQALVFYYEPPGCVKVLDPTLDAAWPKLPALVQRALPFSRLDLIENSDDQPARPPVNIFGPEPAPYWCTYFEKAELARQQNDWKQVTTLGDQALNAGLHPYNPAEFQVFIEGFARSGNWSKALGLTSRSYRSTAWDGRTSLCAVWKRIENSVSLDAQGLAAVNEAKATLQCKLP